MAGERKGIMLCYPFEEKRLQKWDPPYIVQPKLDGERCRAIINSEGNCILLSSTEEIIYGVPHIVKMFEQTGMRDIEFDGELYRHGWVFEKIHGVVSRTVNLHPDHHMIQFHCFDIVEVGVTAQRLTHLITLDREISSPSFVRVYSHICNSLEDVLKCYDEIIHQGYEGIIVRNIHSPYIRTRSTGIMKFKPKKSDTYKIVGFEQEVSISGELKDSLGALILVSDEGTTFNVGSGFTADQRKTYWEVRDGLIGMQCHIQYQHLTAGKHIPRFPVFVSVLRGGS